MWAMVDFIPLFWHLRAVIWILLHSHRTDCFVIQTLYFSLCPWKSALHDGVGSLHCLPFPLGNGTEGVLPELFSSIFCNVDLVDENTAYN